VRNFQLAGVADTVLLKSDTGPHDIADSTNNYHPGFLIPSHPHRSKLDEADWPTPCTLLKGKDHQIMFDDERVIPGNEAVKL
jgi:hypothetical protein